MKLLPSLLLLIILSLMHLQKVATPEKIGIQVSLNHFFQGFSDS